MGRRGKSTDSSVSLHLQIGNALDDGGAGVVDAVEHRLGGCQCAASLYVGALNGPLVESSLVTARHDAPPSAASDAALDAGVSRKELNHCQAGAALIGQS